MAQVYFLKKCHEQMTVFEYFFRKAPFNGSYTVFAGLEDLIDILENIHFDAEDISFLQRGTQQCLFLWCRTYMLFAQGPFRQIANRLPSL